MFPVAYAGIPYTRCRRQTWSDT